MKQAVFRNLFSLKSGELNIRVWQEYPYYFLRKTVFCDPVLPYLIKL